MELLVTLTNKEILGKLVNKNIDGVIFGGLFSNKYNYSKDEIIEINNFCKENNLKRYISIDTFITEDKKVGLYEYLGFITKLNPDGIYFSDLAIAYAAKSFSIENKLIYDPVTLNTNSNDISFYLNKGIGVTLARELTLTEIVEILKKYPYALDMQIFGHLRMSYSKRKFLSNYFKEINIDKDIINKNNITLVEESRNYKLPIKETKYGTSIYTDYVFLMYEEFAYLKKLLKRGIIDTEFIDDETVIDLLRDARRISVDNAEYLKVPFEQKHPMYHFTAGYLYQKTTDKKENNE